MAIARDELALQIYLAYATTPDAAYSAADAWLEAQPRLHRHIWMSGTDPGDVPVKFCECGAKEVDKSVAP